MHSTHRLRPRLRVFVLALAFVAGPAGELRGQALTLPCTANLRPGECPGYPVPTDHRLRGHAVALGVNAAIGGLAAGVVRAARGESFRDGFLQGAAGGGIGYLGKYIATTELPAAWWVGRQTAAIGASITRAALTGEDAFQTLTFPVGPVRIHRDTSGTRFTLDALTLGGAIYGMTRPGAKLDLRETLATGALVFEVDRIREQSSNTEVLGTAVGGAVLHRGSVFHYRAREILAHEFVHVLQHDFAATAFADPFEGWLAGKAPGPLALPLRYLDLGTHTVLKVFVTAIGMTGHDSPWEQEAYFLVRETNGGDYGFIAESGR